MKVFGCACYPLLQPYTKHKLEFQSKQCIFLGYSSNHKGYKCLDPSKNRIYISRNVVFDEKLFPALDTSSNSSPASYSSLDRGMSTLLHIDFEFVNGLSPTLPTVSHTPNASTVELSTTFPAVSNTPNASIDLTTPQEVVHEIVSNSSSTISPATTSSVSAGETTMDYPHLEVTSSDSSPSPTPSPIFVPSPIDIPSHTDDVSPTNTTSESQPLPPIPDPIPSHMVTRSQTGSLKPKDLSDFHLYYSTHRPLKAMYTTTLPREPRKFTRASSNPNWMVAMESEFQALCENRTWSLCSRPHNRNVIRNRWVYKLKQQPDGTIKRYMARLVAKRFEQRVGIDYKGTFSPVIKPATIRLMLSLAVHNNWHLRQIDISNAFLHGNLSEEVFMEQP